MPPRRRGRATPASLAPIPRPHVLPAVDTGRQRDAGTCPSGASRLDQVGKDRNRRAGIRRWRAQDRSRLRRLGGVLEAQGPKSAVHDVVLARWAYVERTIHAKSIVPCPGWTARPDLESAYSAASDSTDTDHRADAPAPGRGGVPPGVDGLTLDARRTSWPRSQPSDRRTTNPAAWAMWSESMCAQSQRRESIVNDGSTVVTHLALAPTSRSSTQAASRTVDGETGQASGCSERRRTARASPSRRRRFAGLAGDVAGIDRRGHLDLDADPAQGLRVSSIAMPDTTGRPAPAHHERGTRGDADPRLVEPHRLVETPVRETRDQGLCTATSPGSVAVGHWPSRDTGCGDSCRPERPSLYTSDDGLARGSGTRTPCPLARTSSARWRR